MKKNAKVWTGVLKLQRPLATNGSMCNVLIYNEDRSIMHEQVMAEKAMKTLFPEGEHKTYWNSRLTRLGAIQIESRAEEQAW